MISKAIRTFSSSSSTERYDVVINGAGMVGSACACALGQSPSLLGKKVLLLEAKTVPTFPESVQAKYFNRVSAIIPGSRRLFERLGVWKRIEEYRVQKVEELKVWESYSQASISFHADDFKAENPFAQYIPNILQLDNCFNDFDSNVQNVAHIIENNIMISAFIERIRSDCPNVAIRENTHLTSCQLSSNLSDRVSMQLSTGEFVEADLLIGADGHQSSVRKAMNVNYLTWPYLHKALVATLNIREKPYGNNNVAYQRFLSNGAIAVLPLNKSTSSLVWMGGDKQIDQLKELDEKSFVDRLNEALMDVRQEDSFSNQTLSIIDLACQRLQNIVPYQFTRSKDFEPDTPVIESIDENSRATFPLHFGHATSYVKNRAVLIGDSAHRIHPLGGQGVNLGFGDVRCLLATLENAVKCGGDLGDLLYLRNYETERQRRNVPTMIGLDWVNRMYRINYAPVILARGLGVNALNHMPVAKKFLMQFASS